MADKLLVTLKKSTVGTNPSARGTIRALGLRRIGQTVEMPDDPAVRGQIRAVSYLVEFEEVKAAPAKKPAAKKPAPKKKEEAEA
jgi:large subunit ribosomal protein L30